MRRIHTDEPSGVTTDKTIHPIKCAYHKCQKLFVPRRKWQRFCTKSCKNYHWQELRQEVTIAIRKKYDSHSEE